MGIDSKTTVTATCDCEGCGKSIPSEKLNTVPRVEVNVRMPGKPPKRETGVFCNSVCMDKWWQTATTAKLSE